MLWILEDRANVSAAHQFCSGGKAHFQILPHDDEKEKLVAAPHLVAGVEFIAGLSSLLIRKISLALLRVDKHNFNLCFITLVLKQCG